MGRVAIAADPDLLVAFSGLLAEVGAETVAAVSPTNTPALQAVVADRVKIGDLDDLERMAREGRAELVIGNSHASDSAQRLGLPLLRAGFPLYDLLGGYQRTWIGYRGARQALFDLANLVRGMGRGEIEPYRSRLKQWPAGEPGLAA